MKPRQPKEPLTVSPEKTGTEEKPYYTNSSQLPVGYTDDPFLALQLLDDLQRKYTGGTALHLYMSERTSSDRGALILASGNQVHTGI